MGLLQFLREPFPDTNAVGDSIFAAVLSGIIVTIVIYFIQPLNIEDAPSGLFLTCLTYGLITSLVVSLFQFFTIYVLKSDRESQNWTLWKWIAQTIIMILFIALANIIYGHFKFGMDLGFSSIVNIIINTLTIGIAPVTVIGSIMVIRNKKKFTDLAKVLRLPTSNADKPKQKLATLEVQSGNHSITINPEQILFAKSLQNYVQLYTIDQEDISVTTFRKTLSSLEDELGDFGIERCHRSFLVNRIKITSIDGNAQGLKLYFDDTDAMVPVSRKYVSIFR